MSSRQGSDRTVHARYPGMEIVRYDKAGKWYLEPTDTSLKRQAVSINDAVRAAQWGWKNGGTVSVGLPGFWERTTEDETDA